MATKLAKEARLRVREQENKVVAIVVALCMHLGAKLAAALT